MTWLIALVMALVSLTPVWPTVRSRLADPSSTNLGQAPLHRSVAIPARTDQKTALELQSASAYAVDLDSASTLYSHHSTKSLPIASITKLITVMVILENHHPTETVTIPVLPAYRPEDAKLGLVPGQRFALQDLLQAALIPSANDAADALAIYDSGSITAFTSKMNRLTRQWGIGSTNFTTASGLSETNNFATAEALSKLSRIALHNPDFAKWISTPTTRITDLSGQQFNLVSTNRLLADPRFSGIKTGYTPIAGQSLLALVNIKGHRVITVVLNSPDRFAETTSLANWLEHNWTWK